jgi:hypothetical protein
MPPHLLSRTHRQGHAPLAGRTYHLQFPPLSMKLPRSLTDAFEENKRQKAGEIVQITAPAALE